MIEKKWQELLDAANALWTDAAEGGVGTTAIVGGYLIRRLACAVVDIEGDNTKNREYAEQWPTSTETD